MKQVCGTSAVPPDDAAAPPHQSDGAVVQRPAELLGRLPQQHEALSVRNDLGGVKSLDKQKRDAFQKCRDVTAQLRFQLQIETIRFFRESCMKC